ncbi:MAG: hypothetical protein JSW38_09475, partial [Dehalococcoidia bacterium]
LGTYFVGSLNRTRDSISHESGTFSGDISGATQAFDSIASSCIYRCFSNVAHAFYRFRQYITYLLS